MSFINSREKKSPPPILSSYFAKLALQNIKSTVTNLIHKLCMQGTDNDQKVLFKSKDMEGDTKKANITVKTVTDHIDRPANQIQYRIQRL